MLNQVILVGIMSNMKKLDDGFEVTLTTKRDSNSNELIDVNVILSKELAQQMMVCGVKVGSTIGFKGSLNEKHEVKAEKVSTVSVDREHSL